MPVFPFPFPPCTAGRSLLGRCLRGSVCVAATRVGFAHPLRRGASADLFRLPVPVLCIAGLCALLSSHCLHSLSRGVICSSSGCAGGLRALPKLAGRPSVGTPGCPLPRMCLSAGYLGPPSLLQGLCAPVGFVCSATLGSRACLGSQSERSTAFSVHCPPSPWFAWFSKTSQLPFGPACEGDSQRTETPASGLPPSLGAQAPALKFSIFSLFYVSLLSPTSLEAWGLLQLRGCFVEVVPYLEFLMYLQEGLQSPPLSLIPELNFKQLFQGKKKKNDKRF